MVPRRSGGAARRPGAARGFALRPPAPDAGRAARRTIARGPRPPARPSAPRRPGHRLALHARCVLAHYDADPAELLAGVEAQLALFPDDVNLRLSQFGCLRMLGRRDERVALYRELCGRPDADPLLRRQYAQELLADAREHPEVVRLVSAAPPRPPLGPAGPRDARGRRGRRRPDVRDGRALPAGRLPGRQGRGAGSQLLPGGAAPAPRGRGASVPRGPVPSPRRPIGVAGAHAVLGALPARAAAGGLRGPGRGAAAPARGRRAADVRRRGPRRARRVRPGRGAARGRARGSAVAATGCARRPTWPRSGATWPARWSSGSGCSRPSQRPSTPTAPWPAASPRPAAAPPPWSTSPAPASGSPTTTR